MIIKNPLLFTTGGKTIIFWPNSSLSNCNEFSFNSFCSFRFIIVVFIPVAMRRDRLHVCNSKTVPLSFFCAPPYKAGIGESLRLLCLMNWMGTNDHMGKVLPCKDNDSDKRYFHMQFENEAMQWNLGYLQTDVWFRFPVPNAMRNHIYLANYGMVLVLCKVQLFFPLLLMNFLGITICNFIPLRWPSHVI